MSDPPPRLNPYARVLLRNATTWIRRSPYAGGVEADSPGSCEARTRGIWRPFGIRTPAGCEESGICNPCRGKCPLSSTDPGLLRTPGYPLQRLRRTQEARPRSPGGGACGHIFRPPTQQHPNPEWAVQLPLLGPPPRLRASPSPSSNDMDKAEPISRSQSTTPSRTVVGIGW